MKSPVTRRKPQNHIERNIITGMIVSDQYMKQLRPMYKADFLLIEQTRIVAEWCISFWDAYGKAPKKHIADIYKEKVKDGLDDDHAEYISAFLESISEEYERSDKFNVEYLLDQTRKYFRENGLKTLVENIKAAQANGDTDEAEELIASYNTVSVPIDVGVDPFTDIDAIQRAFESRNTPLFRLPGALGEMLNPQLCRDSFVALQGPEKRGKTWWLMELAMRGRRERCNVAVFSVGDMSQDQFIRRQHIYLNKKSDDAKYCGKLLIPVLDCYENQTDRCTMADRTCNMGVYEDGERVPFEEAYGYVPCTHCHKEKEKSFRGAYWWEERDRVEPLTWREAVKTAEKYVRRYRGKSFKLATYPNDSVNVKDLIAQLDAWELVDGFIPDVIIIDYADILAPEDTKKDARHQINDTWKALRRLSQTRHCCVITATQADADSYGKKSLSLKNFSEDKRKYSHVTGIFGLNQTDEEKLDRIMRISELLVREDFSANREVVALGCMEIGRPLLASYWKESKKKEGG